FLCHSPKKTLIYTAIPRTIPPIPLSAILVVESDDQKNTPSRDVSFGAGLILAVGRKGYKSRLERQAERETFERRTKQFEEQIEIQQSKLQTQDTKFEEMEASQHRLGATVRDLAARMAGNNN
ncbi:unnamed protein product, partial [Linum tenue]